MWDHFKDWLGTPYRDSMSALDWFFFCGLLIVIAMGWRFILAHLRGVTAAVAS